jgi:hypothetical protein
LQTFDSYPAKNLSKNVFPSKLCTSAPITRVK